MRENSWVFLEYDKIVFILLTLMIESIINLMSKPYYECREKSTIFHVLEYLRITCQWILIRVSYATSHADTVNETLGFHGPKDNLQ